MTDYDRFFSKVNKTLTCWLWTAGTNLNGYGQFRVKRKLWIAHRFSYELLVGPIPSGLLLMHSCDTPRCVNPEHLTPGTYLDNARDRDSKNRFTVLRGENNGHAKVTSAIVEEMRAIREQTDLTLAQLATMYGVNRSTIHLICKRKVWKHV